MSSEMSLHAKLFVTVRTLVPFLFQMDESDVQASIAFRATDLLTVETEPLVAGDFLYGAVDVTRR